MAQFDSERIPSNYRCVVCGKILPIIGGIIPRNPNWYCPQCGNEGKLGERFTVVD